MTRPRHRLLLTDRERPIVSSQAVDVPGTDSVRTLIASRRADRYAPTARRQTSLGEPTRAGPAFRWSTRSRDSGEDERAAIDVILASPTAVPTTP
jgi:hypothetical protein